MSAIINPRDQLITGAPVRLLPIGLPPNVVIPGIDGIEPNLDAPPMPTGFSAVGSLTFLNILTGAPIFTQGHGYGRTKVYGKVRAPSGPWPVFGEAVNITSFVGQVFSHPTQPGLTWHLWVTWVSKDGVESAPAGGINGQVAATSPDVDKLVAAMTGPGNPFQVVSAPITLADGTVVPVGTYTSNAYMSTFVAGRGNIGLLAVDDARIASIAVGKLTAGSIAVGQYIQSSDYNGQGIGFRLAWNGLDLPNGSINAAKLSVGVGTNLLDNAGFAFGSASWALEESHGVSASLILNLAGYVPVGGNSLAVYQPNDFYNGENDKYQGIYSKPIPVLPGKRYEFSVYTGAHRCNVHALLVFENASGTILSQGASNANAQEAFGGVGLDGFKRLSGFVVAPGGAVAARLYVRKTPTVSGQANSYMFLAQAMVAEAGIGQTTPSSWSLGGTGTKITGAGIETNSITADKINGTNLAVVNGTFSGNLSSAGGSFSGTLSAGVAQVGTLNIGDDAVTVPRASSGLTTASVTMNVMAGKPVYLHGYSAGYTSAAQTTSGVIYVGLQVNGSWVQQDIAVVTGARDDPYVPGIIGSVSILFVHYPPTSGAYTYSFNGAGGQYGGAAFIFAMQAKK